MTTIFNVGGELFKWEDDAQRLAEATLESVTPVKLNSTLSDLNNVARQLGVELPKVKA